MVLIKRDNDCVCYMLEPNDVDTEFTGPDDLSFMVLMKKLDRIRGLKSVDLCGPVTVEYELLGRGPLQLEQAILGVI